MGSLRLAALAVSFLTRIPVRTGEISERDLGESIAFFPVAGAVVGLVTSLADYLVRWLMTGTGGAGAVYPEYVASLLGALASVVAGVLLTGGLHLDGLADTADGLAASRDRERILAVMKDSRVGSAGATWLFLDLIARVCLISALPQTAVRSGLLLLAPVAARTVQAYAVAAYPYARQSGTGKPFSSYASPRHLIVACVLALLPNLSLSLLHGFFGYTLASSFGLLSGALFCARLSRRLGGLTGDAYGAANEVTEVCCLISGVMLL